MGMGGRGDKETRRQGDKESFVSFLLISLSLCPLVPLSSYLPVTLSHLPYATFDSQSHSCARRFRSRSEPASNNDRPLGPQRPVRRRPVRFAAARRGA